MQLTRSFAAGLCAVTLSLAGCAAPMAAPTSTAQTGTAPAPAATTARAAAEAPAAQPAAPVMPAPAAVTAITLTGTASFRGELLSGYAVQVLNAQTGLPVELRNDLVGATGLAVLNQNLVTDAKGQFNLQVVGLTAGQALLVVATKNNVRVEAVVTSNMQSLGAKGYRVAQAGTAFTLTELTTAIAKVARGVLNATQVLTAEASAPVIAELAVEMAALSIKLELQLAANPSFGNQLLVAEGNDGDDAVKTLVSNAGQLQALTVTIAGLVGDIATAAKTGGSTAGGEAAVQARLALIPFIGTVLTGAFANNAFTLTNTINGASVDATAANTSSVTTQVASSGGGSSNNQTIALVSDEPALMAALGDNAIAEIRLTQDIDISWPTVQEAYRVAQVSYAWLYVGRSVIINGGDGKFKLNAGKLNLGRHAITLKNLTVTCRIDTVSHDPRLDGYHVLTDSSPSNVTLDNVTVAPGGDTGLTLSGEGTFTVRNCHFISPEAGDNIGIEIGDISSEATVSVTGTTFDAFGLGINVGSAPASLTINACHFNWCNTGIEHGDIRSLADLEGIAANDFATSASWTFGIHGTYQYSLGENFPVLGVAKLEANNPAATSFENFGGQQQIGLDY